MVLPSRNRVSGYLARLEPTRAPPRLACRGDAVYGHARLPGRWNDASACVGGRHRHGVWIPGFDGYRVRGIWRNAGGGDWSGDGGALSSGLCYDRDRGSGLDGVFRDLIFRVAPPVPLRATFQNLPKSLCLVNVQGEARGKSRMTF